jgi:predicted amidohydrolase YtcJ
MFSEQLHSARGGQSEISHANAIARRLGGRIALGSDFPVESIDPLKGFFAAISRTDEAGDSPHGRDGWFPNQKLTREQALRGFTIDGKFIHPPIWFLSSHTDRPYIG